MRGTLAEYHLTRAPFARGPAEKFPQPELGTAEGSPQM